MSHRPAARHAGLRRTAALAAATVLFLGLSAAGVSAAGPAPRADLLYARGVDHPANHQSRPRSSPNLTWHGGAILGSTTVQAIYWGTSWTEANPKITGLDTFYGGLDGTDYMLSNTEYAGTNGQVVGAGVTSNGHAIDTSAAPSRAPSVSTIQSEVSKVITSPVANAYYPVYIDQKRGSAGYCAWHSYGTVHGKPVEFGFFFNLDGDPGCDPQDTTTGHSQGLAALANVSGHEISETATDPNNGGWWDSKGEENADKCAWTFFGT